MRGGPPMKLAHASIVTNDVPGLSRLYKEVTRMAPSGDDVYFEFHAPALTPATSSQKIIDAGRHERFHTHRGRRPKTSKGRNRGKGHVLGGAARSAMEIWPWTGHS